MKLKLKQVQDEWPFVMGVGMGILWLTIRNRARNWKLREHFSWISYLRIIFHPLSLTKSTQFTSSSLLPTSNKYIECVWWWWGAFKLLPPLLLTSNYAGLSCEPPNNQNANQKTKQRADCHWRHEAGAAPFKSSLSPNASQPFSRLGGST